MTSENRKRGFLCAALVIAGVLAPNEALAENEVSFCKFTDLNQQTLQLNGALALTDLVNLTPNLPNQSGSAYVKTPMTLTSTTSFAAHFRFRLYPNTGGTGGSGLAFVLQNKSLTAGSGSGGGLGLNGVTPSVAVEFDTAQDVVGDPNANHVAIIQDGKSGVHLAFGTPGFNLKSGISTDAWVDYTFATKTMAVYVSQGTGLKPALPLFTHVIDVYDAVKAAQNGNKVYVGFSGATGNTETNTQDVTYLVIGTGTVPSLVDCIPCLTDAQCPANTPACQPNGFCGECSAANTTQCQGGTPVCNTNVGQCVECISNGQCSGNKPICVNNVCVACAGDNGSGDPAQCPTSTQPVCQTQGPTTGSCTQCSADNANLCVAPRPVCLPNVGTCGCANDADCGGATSGQICTGTPGVCVPGCRPAGGNTCPNGQNCEVPPGGTTGICKQPCADGCVGATPVCNTTADQCVQCVNGTDCTTNPNGPLCNPTTNTCVECIPGGDTTQCLADGPGSACRPNGQCGCNTDGDCGNATSGRVCDDTTKVCRAGCRGTGGNGCKQGDVCTSKTTAIGQCVVDVGSDAGADAGAVDAGSDAGTSKNDAGTTTPRPDASTTTPDAGGTGVDDALDDFSIEGGGCACSTLGVSAPALSLGGFGLTAVAFAALARRRRRR